MLDATACGSLMSKNATHTTMIIDAMVVNDHKLKVKYPKMDYIY